MNAKIYNNLQDVYRKTKAVIGELLKRDSEKLDAHDHEREITALSEVLEHLRTVDKEMAQP